MSCWGLNRKGELGNGDTEDRSSPTAVTGISDAQCLAASRWRLLRAVRGNGSVWCWGDNLGGPLGTGGVTSDPNPTPRALPFFFFFDRRSAGRLASGPASWGDGMTNVRTLPPPLDVSAAE